MKSIDVSFHFSRVMFHYGLSYRDALDLPVKTFWMLVGSIDRLLAETDMRQFKLLVSHQSKEAAQETIRDLHNQLGEVVEKDPVESAVYERDKLKSLMGTVRRQDTKRGKRVILPKES